MQTSMYNALFGALTQQNRVNVIANNLANVNTSGFKKEKMAFKDVFLRQNMNIMQPATSLRTPSIFPDPELLSQTRIDVSRVDFSQGTLKKTDNPLDMAIQGDGFFKVQDGEGVAYSRNGRFMLTPEGGLVTNEGKTVLGQGGVIEIPEGTKDIIIGNKGQVLADGVEVDVLNMVSIADPSVLEKRGHHLYRAEPGQTEEIPFEGEVYQGFLEGSNVEVVEEMVKMIEAMRAFEAYQRVMKSTHETDKRLIQQVGTIR